MLGARLGLRPIDLSVRVSEVHQDALDVGTRRNDERADAALSHRLEHGLLHLQVPAPVGFTSLQSGTSCCGCVAATFELDLLEVWLVRLAIVLVDLVQDGIARSEFGHLVWAGASRIQIELSVTGLGAHEVCQGCASAGSAHQSQSRRPNTSLVRLLEVDP